MLYKTEKIPDLYKLIQRLKKLNFSIETQYKFLKLSKAIEEEMQIINQQNNQLIQDYCERDSQGNPIINKDSGYKIKEDKIQECAKKIQELNSIQIKLPDVYFSFDELEPLQLTLGELELLDQFVKT